MWAFNAVTAAFANTAITGAGGAYSHQPRPRAPTSSGSPAWPATPTRPTAPTAPTPTPPCQPHHDQPDGEHRHGRRAHHPHRQRHGDRRRHGVSASRGLGLRRGHRGLRHDRRHAGRRGLQPSASPPGTYKLWFTGVAGYPDQAYGPDGTYANATVVNLTTTSQTANIVMAAAPTTHTVSGTVTAGGTGARRAAVWAFDSVTAAFAKRRHRGRRGLQPSPSPRAPTSSRSSRRGGLSRPGLRPRRHLAQPPVTVTADQPDGEHRPAALTLARNRAHMARPAPHEAGRATV